MDGDTTADIAVGACLEDVDGSPDRGRVYVFSSDTGSLLRILDAPSGVQDGLFGVSVAVDDVNGDTTGDIAVGASRSNVGIVSAQGRAYVFSGADGSLLHTLDSPNGEVSGEFGWSVALGRVNSDSNADIVVAAHAEDVNGATEQGRAYVFSGTDWSLLYTLTTPEARPFAQFGSSVAVGDVNADGRGDIAVGASSEQVGANSTQGRAYVFSGANRSLLLALDTPNPQAIAYFGSPVAVGDVNGDGVGDIAVGASSETVGGNVAQGRAYVFSAGGLPPSGTDHYHVQFSAANIRLDGQDKGPFAATGTATVVRGAPYWSGGRQCADFTIKSLTLKGTLNGVLVVIKVGEGLTVPVSSGVVCEGDVTLHLYVEEWDQGGGQLSSSPILAQGGNHLCNCWDGQRWSSIDCTAVVSEVPPNQITYDCGTSYSLCDCSTNDQRVRVDTPQTGGLLLSAVGGIARLPDTTAGSDQSARSSSGWGFNYTALGGALAAVAIAALAAGAWLARRRWAR